MSGGLDKSRVESLVREALRGLVGTRPTGTQAQAVPSG